MLRAATYGKGRANLHKALSERLPFTTSGALRGDTLSPTAPLPMSGRLSGEDKTAYHRDGASITYIVWSYETPIAWVREDGQVYRVAQKFTPTTSKHQGMMYLL